MLLKYHNHILRDALIQTLQRNERVRTNHFAIIRHHCYTCIPLFTLVFIRVLKRPVSQVVETQARLSTLQITIHRKGTSHVPYQEKQKKHFFSRFSSTFTSDSQLNNRLLKSSSETVNLLAPILYKLGHRRGNTIYSCKGCSVRSENNS